MIGATSMLPIFRAIAVAVPWSTSLCLFVVSQGPFSSTLPVGIRTLVLPALIASRTSSSVSCWIQTSSVGGSGFG